MSSFVESATVPLSVPAHLYDPVHKQRQARVHKLPVEAINCARFLGTTPCVARRLTLQENSS